MNKFMQVAIEEAFKGIRKKHGGPFGAVIVRNGKIISKEHNLVLKTNDPTAHAEVTAIRNASKKLKTFDLSDCELYTSCEPCPMCLSAIYWARIPKVYFGCSEKDAEGLGFKDKLIHDILKGKKTKLLTMKQLGRKESLKPFREFNSREDKVIY